MKIEEFIRHVSAEPPFKDVRLSNSPEFSNCLLASGDVVGRERLDELVRLGRLYGIEVIADCINVWENEEFFREFGALSKEK